MAIPLPRIFSAVPQAMHVRIEIAKAAQTLAAQDRSRSDSRRAEIAAIRRDLDEIALEFAKALRECAQSLRSELRKYNADEPRVPRGYPDGGEWTYGPQYAAATANDWSSILRRRGGDHFVPKAEYKKYPFKPETRRVFNNARTGPLKPTHGWSEPHVDYNKAVAEALKQFLDRNSIKPEEMTPDQAQEFIFEIIGSRDPRIRDFNLKLYRREIMRYILHHIPINPDGLEGGADED